MNITRVIGHVEVVVFLVLLIASKATAQPRGEEDGLVDIPDLGTVNLSDFAVELREKVRLATSGESEPAGIVGDVAPLPEPTPLYKPDLNTVRAEHAAWSQRSP